MSPLSVFAWGAFGSISLEIVTIYKIFTDENGFPNRYKQILFWFIRILLAVIAGGLALAYEIDKPILALNIGASTPLIIQAIVNRVPEE